jgi:hypothetical protein
MRRGSTDGLTWEELPGSAFVPRRSIFYIGFGWVEPNEARPLP